MIYWCKVDWLAKGISGVLAGSTTVGIVKGTTVGLDEVTIKGLVKGTRELEIYSIIIRYILGLLSLFITHFASGPHRYNPVWFFLFFKRVYVFSILSSIFTGPEPTNLIPALKLMV